MLARGLNLLHPPTAGTPDASRWNTGRVEAFSDGVFAIAITLLVLELSVPKEDFDDLWRGILDQWPAYLGYATSFTTIGAIWLLHHGVFRRLAYVDGVVIRLNLLLLMIVSFVPFPTKLVAEAIHDRTAERAAVVLYGATLFAVSLVFGAMWEAAVRRRDLLRPEVTEAEVRAMGRTTRPNPVVYLAITLGALLAPRLA